MNGINRVTLIGHAGKDPEISMAGEKKKAEFSLATSEKWTDKNGEKKESTEWHNIVVWGPLAGVVESYVKKGNPLYIEGKIRTERWEKEGEKRQRTTIIADSLLMLGGKSDTGNPITDEKTEDQKMTAREIIQARQEAMNLEGGKMDDDGLPF